MQSSGSGLPLQSFFLALKQNGFLVTPQQVVDANRIIGEFADDLRNEEELCLYLSPLFARNEEEQQQFEEIFRAHFKPLPVNEVFALRHHSDQKGHWQKHWWAYAIGGVVLLTALYFLTRSKAVPPLKLPQLFIADNGNYLRGADGQQEFQVAVGKTLNVTVSFQEGQVNTDSSFSLQARFGWGDSDALTADSSHAWQRPGLYTIVAYADLLQHGKIVRRDTLTATAKVCATLARLTLLNPAGDSIEAGRKVRFQAKLSGPPPDSILWAVNDQRLGYGVSFETAFTQPGFTTLACVAIYDSLDAPCTVANYARFEVYDPYDFAVSLAPAPGAKPLQLSYKVKPVAFYLAIGLTVVLLVAFLWLAVRWSRQKRSEKQQAETDQQFTDWLRTFSGKKRPAPMPFRDKAYLSVPEPELKMAAMQMRRRIASGATVLDIPKTIDTAIRRKGYLEPLYSTRRQESEYLVLIDSSHNNNQQVRLFDFLVDTLRKQNIHLEKWYYRYEPSLCYTTLEPAGVTLEKLSERFPNHILLIFGNAYQLLQPYYPVINPDYLQLLSRWQHKAVLTPVSLPDWSTKEWDALSPNLPVVPVDVEGQLVLMDSLFAANYDLPSALKLLRSRFYPVAPVDFENLEELQAYCHEAAWARKDKADPSTNILFQWIAALAVYPRINWEITLSVGKAILDRYGQPGELNFTNLLRLARIKWMKDGQFPDYTRLDLLKSLQLANEVIARETILAMLDEIPETELNASHMAYEEKEVQRVTNEFLLYAHNPEKYSLFGRSKVYFEKLWKQNQVRDAAAQVYLKNENKEWSTLVGGKADSSQRLDDYFAPEKAPDDGPRRRLKHLLYSVLALFCLSVLATIALLVIHLLGIESLPALTYRPPRTEYIGFVPDDKTNIPEDRFAVEGDRSGDPDEYHLRKKLDSGFAVTLPMLVSDSPETVAVLFDEKNIYQTLLPVKFSQYLVTISRNTSKPTLSILVPGQCEPQAEEYRRVARRTLSGMVVKDSLVGNKTTGDGACLNQIAFGYSVDAADVEKLVAAFRQIGVSLSPAGVQTAPLAANEIRLFYREAPPPPKSLIYIQYNDRSKLGQVQQLQRALNAAGFAAPGVEFQPASNAFNADEIRYFDPSFRDSIKLLQALLGKVYPNRAFKAVQARVKRSLARAEIWVRDKPDVIAEALFDIDGATWQAAAQSLGCDVAALKAVAEVEHFDPPYTRSDFGNIPLVRFEPHIFWKQLQEKKIDPTPYAQKDSDILYPAWKAAVYGSRSAQYKKLQRAEQIDKEAALMATAWGMFQIMGFNYKLCGFKSVEAFTNAVRNDKAAELQALATLIKRHGIDDELRRLDWAGFVRGYQGVSSPSNQNKAKSLQAAYQKYSKTDLQQMNIQGYGNQLPQKPRKKGN